MKPVDLTITVNQPPAEAQTRVLEQVAPRLPGFTERRGPDAVEYRPKVAWPIALWLARLIQGERISFTFVPHGEGTEVRASGRLRDRVHADVIEALDGQ